MNYQPNSDRYNKMTYNRCGNSGLLLPAFSLGLWHNFGHMDDFDNARTIVRKAFDAGITHFDLANNYGPPAGSAETNFGKIFKSDLAAYRDEVIISTKAGWKMWDGPYGDFGSKKYLVASLDQSLKRMGLDYVDIFYHHRPDPATPLEETIGTLDLMVRQGKALYVGISSYSAEETTEALKMFKELGTPCLIHQPRYSMFDRWIEDGLLDVLGQEGVGCIVFSPLEQGLLTNKYLKGIPASSRAASGRGNGAIEADQITPEKLETVRKLNEVAQKRGQSLAQMALSWAKRDPRVTSVLLGVSRPEQLEDSLEALKNPDFDEAELNTLENILSGKSN
ncbi:L-glyceraldehyde 3-phosphate reductase [Flagellimonas beolgyonensis]|uniref:L-glyceraldehyde 3-phosphate reductase n=1 Tax=Flagellimonas beolgyonensis TaxID=864064 RepID=UPI000F8C3F1E|nr:L-glyceraldehyde 3-phosphate reductase [Allomuricauda beolgyonensis]